MLIRFTPVARLLPGVWVPGSDGAHLVVTDHGSRVVTEPTLFGVVARRVRYDHRRAGWVNAGPPRHFRSVSHAAWELRTPSD